MKSPIARYLLFFGLCIVVLAILASEAHHSSLAQANESVTTTTRRVSRAPSLIGASSFLKPNLVASSLPLPLQDAPCAPLGDPMDGTKYKGNNAFYLCKEGESFNSGVWGASVELFIACRPSTRRAGTKWHIWCKTDGSRCGCNRQDFNGGEQSCCQWSAGDHCTNDGASPGKNGCATW